ncbi:MAG: repeat-containing protein [Bacteroidetes bacterium]|jgi:hypothetical protein|nr:repeat-containing protein [Bacteroidota bacterium]
MYTIRIFTALFLLLQLGSFAQPWEPDAFTNMFVKRIKQGSEASLRYGLVRYGDGDKTDTIPAVYECVCRYEGYPEPGYLGRKDSAWYKLDFGTSPFRVPAKKYLGADLFISKNGKTYSVYSVTEGRNVLENCVLFSTGMEDILPVEEEWSDELPQFKPVFNAMINDELWLKNAEGTMYWLSNYGGIYIKNIGVISKKTGNKTLYGISHLSSGTKAKVFAAPVYDKVELYSRAYALKGTTYDVYNSLMHKIAESEEILFIEGSDLVPVKKKGKYGLVSPYGKDILPAVFDTLYGHQLIVAHKKDSVFFYERGRLVTALSKTPSTVYQTKGSYDLLPFYVYAISGATEKCVFVYNPYDRSVLGTSAYTDVFFYSISKNHYLLAVKQNGKYGLIDLKGNIIHSFEYEFLSRSLLTSYWNDTIGAHVAVRNGKTGFIGSDLQTLVPFEYDGISGMNFNDRLMYREFALKKGKQWHLYRYADKFLSPYGYDTLLLNTEYSSSIGWRKNKPDMGVKNGQKFLIDSTGKAYFDFSKVSITEHDNNYVALEEKTLNEIPLNITPLASLNRVEDLNTEHHYAIAFCLNRYFIINKYGEMSAGFEVPPDHYDHERGYIFVKRLKKQNAPGLYDFKGRELGKMSEAKIAYMEYDMQSKEVYYLFTDKKGLKGLMNAKGELILENKYADIGTISDGKCEVWEKKEAQPYTVDLKSLKPLTWK